MDQGPGSGCSEGRLTRADCKLVPILGSWPIFPGGSEIGRGVHVYMTEMGKHHKSCDFGAGCETCTGMCVLSARVCGDTCARSQGGTGSGPAPRATRSPSACAHQALPHPAHTHQPQVLHGLREHALVQLQLAHLHDLHTSDRVASWEEDPGRNRRANSVSGSHLCSQFHRETRRGWLTLAGHAAATEKVSCGGRRRGSGPRDDRAGCLSNKHCGRDTRLTVCIPSGGGVERPGACLRVTSQDTPAPGTALEQKMATRYKLSQQMFTAPRELLRALFSLQSPGIPVVGFLTAHLTCRT